MFIRPGRTIYSVNVPCLAVAAPDVFKKVVILGDGARGAPACAAGTILEPQLLNQRGFGFVQSKGEGTGELGKRLDATRQVGVQGTATALPAVGGIVRHGGQVGALAQQHVAQAVDHRQLGAVGGLDGRAEICQLLSLLRRNAFLICFCYIIEKNTFF